MTGKELYGQMSDFVNNMCHNNGEVTEAFSRDHKYLQSEIVGLCLEIIKKASDMYKDGNFDGRNEYVLKLCRN